MVAAYSLLIPRTSVRVPSFFGPVLLSVALMIASCFTAPSYEGFNVAKFNEPTFKGTAGIWGVCISYKQYNATTANPTANLTGNTTFDQQLKGQGKNKGCSKSTIGYSFALPVNSTGQTTLALPNTTLGFNAKDGAPVEEMEGYTWKRVITTGQTSILILHVIAAMVGALAMLLIVLPYKWFEDSAPALARFIKGGSMVILLVLIFGALTLVSFVFELIACLNVRNSINAATQPGGVSASLGNLMWFSLPCVILLIPPMFASRSRMGDSGP